MGVIQIKKGDITKEAVDAIVNAANTTLLGGGGVDGAIHRAAGPRLLAECITLGGCATGQAKITRGYNLPAKYVIHTPGPHWRGGKHREPELLKNSYVNSLQHAVAKGIASIAFPSISTGIYRFPVAQACRIALSTVREFLARHNELECVVFVCFNEDVYQAYVDASLELGIDYTV